MKAIDGDYVRDEILFGEAYVSDELAVYIKRVFDDAPTIEAEPVRRGKWIWDDNAIDWGIGAWVCSECHGRNENIHAGKGDNPNVWSGSRFCNNCGAKMDGGENDGQAD